MRTPALPLVTAANRLGITKMRFKLYCAELGITACRTDKRTRRPLYAVRDVESIAEHMRRPDYLK